MHKIILCLYGAPRQSIPTLMGRSGTTYGRAYFNEKEMRHECGPFDLDTYHKVMLPDISKFRSAIPQVWFAVVQMSDEVVDVSKLANELDAAKTRIAELEALQTSETKFTSPSLAAAEEPAVEKKMSDYTVRELRQMVKDMELELPHNSTKEQLIGILEGAAVPA